MADLSVNGKALVNLSCYVSGLTDLRGRAAHKYPVVSLWGRAGGWATWPSVAGRIITVTARIVTTAATAAARLTAEQTLKDWLGNTGLARLQVDEGNPPVLTIDAYLEELSITPVGHPLTAVVSDVTMRWNAPDPLWAAASETIISAPTAGTRYSLPLGTAPSTPIVRIMGSATNPTLTIRDSGGVARVTVAITLTLGANDYLEYDCRTGAAIKSVSGTRSSIMSVLTSGGDPFPFLLDPAWGDYANSRWPTMESSAGNAEALYLARYW